MEVGLSEDLEARLREQARREASAYGDDVPTARVMREAADALAAARDRMEQKSAQAYQVIGVLLERVGLFESDEGQRALDYFGHDTTIVDDEFLPWPRGEWSDGHAET
jgi:hypothetical protein